MEIRLAQENDIDGVMLMQQQLSKEDIIYGSTHKSEDLAVIPQGEQYLEIDDVYVKPKHRSKGIGKTLMAKIMEIAKENGIERFLIYSASKDTDRIKKFYERVGLKSWYIQMFK